MTAAIAMAAQGRLTLLADMICLEAWLMLSPGLAHVVARGLVGEELAQEIFGIIMPCEVFVGDFP